MPDPSPSAPDAPKTAAAERPRSSDGVILLVVCLAQFMVVLDVSIVNVALPAIQSSLHFRAVDLQWVVTAYALTFGGLLLLGGRLADLFGRRRIFLFGLGLFTLASLIGGFATNQATLIAARSLQGVGAAILSPATLTILTVTFQDQRARARAFGMWSAVAAGGGAAGALFGGILTQYLSWRWILFVNVPIGIALYAVARLRLHESKADGPRRSLDVAGAVTVTGALFLLVYAISHTDAVAWTSTSTLVVLLASFLLLVAFIAIEAKVATHPLIPLRLFRVRSVTGANLVMFCFGVGTFAMWFFLSLFLQQVLGYSPVVTGLTFLPQTVAIAAGATLSGRVSPRFGPRNVLMAGALMGAGGLFWLSFIQASDNYWTGVCGGGILATFGMGLAFTPIALLATGGVPHEDAGLASGLVNCSRQIGASIGLAALTTLAASRTAAVLGGTTHTGHSSSVSEAVKVAMTDGYARAFLIAAVVVLIGGAVGFIIPPPSTGPTGTTAADWDDNTDQASAPALLD